MMTRLTTQLAGGRVILALEGGYELAPLANSATACLDQLLIASRAHSPPMEGALRTLRPCVTAQECLAVAWGDHWASLREGLSPLETGWVMPKEWKRGKSGGGNGGVFGTPSAERRKRRLSSEGY